MRRSNKNFVDYETAKEFAHSLNLCSLFIWFKIKREDLPTDIPSYPDVFYRNKGWTGWEDFLNSKENREKYKWKTFEEAKKIVNKFNISNRKDWFDFTKSENFPEGIPIHPDVAYKNKGWINYPDFLGYEYKNEKRKFIPFFKARTFARNLNINSLNKWKSFCKTGKKPFNIPADPVTTYAKQWNGWSDFLGNGRRRFSRKNDWIDYNELKNLVKKLKIKSIPQYRRAIKQGKLPTNVPVNPQVVYV